MRIPEDKRHMAAGPQSKAIPSSVRTHGIVEVFSLVGDEVLSPAFLPQHLQPACWRDIPHAALCSRGQHFGDNEWVARG